MSRAHSILRRLVAVAVATAATCAPLLATGPLVTINGQPVIWSSATISGGPLNATTVTTDATGKRTVFYHVDSGPLGPLSNLEAVHFVDRIFGEYTDIPTANIDFVNAGPLRDPDTGLVVDVNGTNIGKFFNPTLQNPIIFDSDGAITGTGGVLGFFTFLATAQVGNTVGIAEGMVVLNGSVIGTLLDPASFLGVFTHEFGHFAGPLDHSQINGNIALNGAGSVRPPGFTAGSAYDLFAPFTETLFPFVFAPRAGSTQPLDSGFFIATMDRDTISGLSNLYPMPLYDQTTGAIDGRVFFRSGDTKVPLDGMNIVARRISDGSYPPAPGTAAFPTPPTFDADGVPSPPPPQAATDPLASVSSAVTGLDFGFGGYRIRGLAPGDYMVQLQMIQPAATGGSSIGPLTFQATLPVREEYFRKDDTSASAASFTPVKVKAGVTRQAIDLEVLGLDTAEPLALAESDSHVTKATAQDLPSLPALVQGGVAETDPATVQVVFGPGSVANVPDLYKFTLTSVKTVFISLEPIGEGAHFDADVDLYLFRPTFGPTTVPIGPQVPRYSITSTAHELIAVGLGPGTWYIGVGAFQGSAKYRLRVVPSM